MVCLSVNNINYELSLAELGSIIEGLLTTFPADSPQVELAQHLIDEAYIAFDNAELFDMWCDEFHI